jgi:hypothetical protein
MGIDLGLGIRIGSWNPQQAGAVANVIDAAVDGDTAY